MFVADLFAYTFTGTSFGTWEDYAVAFISGGLIKAMGMTGFLMSLSRLVTNADRNEERIKSQKGRFIWDYIY